MSMDAFWYLKAGKEPLLDDGAVDEALRIRAGLDSRFPDGYELADHTAGPSPGMVTATVRPLAAEDPGDYDLRSVLWKGLEVRLKWLDGDRVKAWLVDGNGKRSGLGEEGYPGYFVVRGKGDRRSFHTCRDQEGEFIPGKGCLFFLKRFVEK